MGHADDADYRLTAMANFNTARLNLRCPRCGRRSDVDVQLWVGERTQKRYALGDEIRWRRSVAGRGARPRFEAGEARPKGGDLDGEGFAICPKCDAAIGLAAHVRSDHLDSVTIDFDKTSQWTRHRVDPARASPGHWAVRKPAADP